MRAALVGGEEHQGVERQVDPEVEGRHDRDAGDGCHWKQREKKIERVVKSTVGLYGDMQGIIGGQIPAIPTLELEGDTVRELPDGAAGVETEEGED